MILGLVLNDLMLPKMKNDCDPMYILPTYRSLILTCKLFKTIIDVAIPKIVIHGQQYVPALVIDTGRFHIDGADVSKWLGIVELGVFASEQPSLHQPLGPHSHQTFQRLKKWDDVFKAFQRSRVVHHVCEYLPQYNPTRIQLQITKTIGRFWKNPTVTPYDLPIPQSTRMVLNFAELLSLLRPLFERHKRGPTRYERSNLSPPLPPGRTAVDIEVVNVIRNEGRGRTTVYSIRSCPLKDVYTRLPYAKFAAAVKEWWVLEAPKTWVYTPSCYLVGYYKGTACVVHFPSGEVYRKPAPGGRPPWR